MRDCPPYIRTIGRCAEVDLVEVLANAARCASQVSRRCGLLMAHILWPDEGVA